MAGKCQPDLGRIRTPIVEVIQHLIDLQAPYLAWDRPALQKHYKATFEALIRLGLMVSAEPLVYPLSKADVMAAARRLNKP